MTRKFEVRNRLFALCGALALCCASAAAFAADTPPTLPDGLVASPPGWSCTASGGKVTCVRKVSKPVSSA